MQLDTYITYFKTTIFNPIKATLTPYMTYKGFDKNEMDFGWVIPLKNKLIIKTQLYSRYAIYSSNEYLNDLHNTFCLI